VLGTNAVLKSLTRHQREAFGLLPQSAPLMLLPAKEIARACLVSRELKGYAGYRRGKQ